MTAYRRPHSVLCYWHEGRFVVENYLRRAPMAADPVAVRLLDACPTWTSAGELAEALPDLAPADVEAAAEALCSAGLLLRDDDREAVARDDALREHWGTWSTEAPFAHFATKNAPFIEDPVERGEVAQVLTAGGRPPLFKREPEAPRVLLPRLPPPDRAEFWDVLYRRRTHRAFSGESIPLDVFSTLLAAVFGPVRFIDAHHFGTLVQKTSACAGSRHEHEVYVATFDVEGVEAGLWHYSGLDHALERVGDVERQQVGWLAYRQDWCGEAAFVCFVTAVVERITSKYQHSRSYRAMLLNAGHLGQTFALVATALGLGPFQTPAVRDEDVEALLGVDGISETVLYLLGAGAAAPANGVAPGGPPAAGLEAASRTRLH